MARRQGFVDDLLEIGCKLPRQVAILLAVGLFVGLHVVAAQTSSRAAGTTLTELGGLVHHSLIHEFAAIFQYLLPAGILIGVLGAIVRQSRAKSRYGGARANPAVVVSAMSWRDCEGWSARHSGSVDLP